MKNGSCSLPESADLLLQCREFIGLYHRTRFQTRPEQERKEALERMAGILAAISGMTPPRHG